MNKDVFISTEVWKTQKGVVTKAVVRDHKGHFIGATNQTKNIPLSSKKRFKFVGK